MKMFGFFYYSKKQSEALRQMCKHRVFAKSIFGGRPVEYSEWESRFPFLPAGSWNDYRLVCIGYFDHAEGAQK